MKTLIASVMAAGLSLGLMAGAADAAVIGLHVGPVGVGVGHYHYHNHYYGHRRWERDHYRYW